MHPYRQEYSFAKAVVVWRKKIWSNAVLRNVPPPCPNAAGDLSLMEAQAGPGPLRLSGTRPFKTLNGCEWAAGDDVRGL
jgi:hypothetical protein